jgi:hypothetical protein
MSGAAVPLSVSSSARPLVGVAIYVFLAYNAFMTITFDPEKNAANLNKHGVSLAEGDGVLNDPLALTIEDTAAEGEHRFVTIGTNLFGHLRVIVYTYRGEAVRIISVRKPEPKEARAYEEGI